MTKIYLLFLISLLGIYGIANTLSFEQSGFSQGDRLSNELVAKIGKKLGEKHGMFVSGIGGAEKDGIGLISITFSRYCDPLNVENGRRVLVDCVQEFLSAINQDELLRPYLRDFPFTPANLEIDILSYTTEGKLIFDPHLEVVSEYKGTVIYRTRDPDDRYKYKLDISESYEEALKIVQNEKMVNQHTQ